jgi:hypothetical protein
MIGKSRTGEKKTLPMKLDARLRFITSLKINIDINIARSHRSDRLQSVALFLQYFAKVNCLNQTEDNTNFIKRVDSHFED